MKNYITPTLTVVVFGLLILAVITLIAAVPSARDLVYMVWSG